MLYTHIPIDKMKTRLVQVCRQVVFQAENKWNFRSYFVSWENAFGPREKHKSNFGFHLQKDFEVSRLLLLQKTCTYHLTLTVGYIFKNIANLLMIVVGKCKTIFLKGNGFKKLCVLLTYLFLYTDWQITILYNEILTRKIDLLSFFTRESIAKIRKSTFHVKKSIWNAFF